MRIGVICEGHSDRAVIENIVCGISGLDTSDILPLRPENRYDATDLAALNEKTFSTWSLVKKECEEREIFEMFYDVNEDGYIVIHLDTAEADQYGVNRPKKENGNYCESLRNEVINKINEWLDNNYSERIILAIAIEEIEAWLLTMHEKKDSTQSPNPKKKFHRILGAKNINSTIDYTNYFSLSKSFAKEKDIRKGDFLKYNCSLRLFYEDVMVKLKPNDNE